MEQAGLWLAYRQKNCHNKHFDSKFHSMPNKPTIEFNTLPFRWGVGFDVRFVLHLTIDSYQWTEHDDYWREDLQRVRYDLEGTSRAIKVLRETMPDLEIVLSFGMTDACTADNRSGNLSDSYVYQRTQEQYLEIDLLQGRVNSARSLHPWLREHGLSPSAEDWFLRHLQTVDVVELSCYAQSEVRNNNRLGGLNRHIETEQPSRLYNTIYNLWEGDRLPILIAETSLPGHDDDQSRRLKDSVDEVRRLRAEGIPVLGYAWSSFLDHIGWDGTQPHGTGHIHSVGIYCLARQSVSKLERTPSALRDTYRELMMRGMEPVGEIAAVKTARAVRAAKAANTAVETRLTNQTSADLAERENLMETTILDGAKVLSNDKKSSYATLSYPIIVHCHLHWDWVWQRPQQFLSRLAKKHRILFVEGPQLVDEDIAPYYTLREEPTYSNITIMQTFFPSSRFQDGRWVDSERLRLLKEATGKELAGKFNEPVQWFYDPMAVCAFVGQMDEIATVYDCMDQLSQFKFAPPELIERERILLEAADVVFAGGRKMWEDKRLHNPNCHFYGCGVDVAHFSKARKAETALPEDLAAIQGPILGYFGVVDERLDYELIAKLADENPNWSIAMVGPVCKVDPADLPQRSNLHWLGGRDYSQLPSYTKGFDVALMPFARNEATEYINPTKALEYMATGTPIVSSDVPDVVSNFAQVVKIATNHDEFIAMCRKSLAQPDEVAVERGLKMADANTWDAIVAKLEKHIKDALDSKSLEEIADEKVASSAA
jgi:glycosyltransferase involved in cell wall biosynthesis